MPSFAVILPAAGKSARFADKEKKVFANLDGRPVWLRAAELFVNRNDVCQCLVVIAPGDQEVFQRKFGPHLGLLGAQVVLGGAERPDSVANALAAVRPDADLVAVHDASSMADAVRQAYELARPAGTVVLAPACSSFDMFADYAERGRRFKEEVSRLIRDREDIGEQ
jgi:2-C-methyl-D-erythritol 4-phosphate cytidylyltransferase